MRADICVGKRQQVLQGVDGGSQAEDKGIRLVLAPRGPDGPGVRWRAWGLERQAQIIARVSRMRYYPTRLAPVVNREVKLPLERLRVNLNKAGRLLSQHRKIDENREDSATL